MDRWNANLSIAFWTYDATLEKGTSVDDFELVADMRRQTYRKPCQRQAHPPSPTKLCICTPWRFPPVRTHCFELDVTRRQNFEWSNAEGFNAQLLIGIADPARALKAPVAEPLDMQHDFGLNFSPFSAKAQ